MGNCIASKRDEQQQYVHTSKVQPFRRDGSFLNKGPLLGSARGFNDLENSVNLHRQHTAKLRSSKVFENNAVVTLDDSKEENKLD